MRLIFLCTILISQMSFAMATSLLEPIKVFSKENNIYYILASKKIMQATYSNKDHSPILSPNKKIIAFTRESSMVIPENCNDFVNLNNNHPIQIWIYDIKAKKQYLIVKNNYSCNDPERKILDPFNLQFSLDSRKLFFMTSAWATSSALHSIDINKKNSNYLMPALDYKVLQNGKHKGLLLVKQHKYHNQGGSFDWEGLFTYQGKEEMEKSSLAFG